MVKVAGDKAPISGPTSVFNKLPLENDLYGSRHRDALHAGDIMSI